MGGVLGQDSSVVAWQDMMLVVGWSRSFAVVKHDEMFAVGWEIELTVAEEQVLHMRRDEEFLSSAM